MWSLDELFLSQSNPLFSLRPLRTEDPAVIFLLWKIGYSACQQLYFQPSALCQFWAWLRGFCQRQMAFQWLNDSSMARVINGPKITEISLNFIVGFILACCSDEPASAKCWVFSVPWGLWKVLVAASASLGSACAQHWNEWNYWIHQL